jgi:hypothetical protein
MVGRSIGGGCWLVCCDNTVTLSADSLLALIALTIGRAWRRVTSGIPLIFDTIRRCVAGMGKQRVP